VAELLHENGFGEQVVAAALLHVVEDSTIEVEEIGEGFGPEVAQLVAEMTEDASIEPYEERKAEHRTRVRRDPCVAAIYAADKLANTRALKEDPAAVPTAKIEHYAETLRTLRAAHPTLPFLDELEGELDEVLRARWA
jgi:(p)ppGpp synthase/HD superfamily hydrolase